MADRRENVVMLPGRGWVGREQAGYPDIARTTVGQLDELSHHLQQLSPHMHWSARRWMIASTPFRMRLTGARRRLSELRVMSAAGGQHPGRGALELSDACLDAERRLHEIDTCLKAAANGDPRHGAHTSGRNIRFRKIQPPEGVR